MTLELEDSAELQRLLRELMDLTGEDEETAIANAVRAALARRKSDQDAEPSARE